jgi:hypothetical protein
MINRNCCTASGHDLACLPGNEGCTGVQSAGWTGCMVVFPNCFGACHLVIELFGRMKADRSDGCL